MSLPWLQAKPSKRPKRNSSGSVLVGIGLFMASLLDPKTKVQTELIDRKQSRERTEPGKENA
jgi:hypothetical protein